MTKLEQVAKAYAEAHAWERKCAASHKAALREYTAVSFGNDDDEKRRYQEATSVALDALRRENDAALRLMRVARGEE